MAMDLSLSLPSGSGHRTTTPFDMKSIFQQILDYVGTDHDSLKTCRLVAHPWNESALEVLRRKGAKMIIRKSGVEPTRSPRSRTSVVASTSAQAKANTNPNGHSNLKQILKSSLGEKRLGLIPCGIKLESALTSLNLSFDIESERCEDPEEPINQVIREISRGHNLMLTEIIFGGTGNYETQLNNLRFILFSCSSTLKVLDYTQRNGEYCKENPWPIDNFQDVCCTFPNLTNIRICIVSLGQQYLNPVLMDVVNSSPNLRAIAFEYVSPALAWHPTSKILSNFRARLSPDTRRRIQELTIPAPHWRSDDSDFFNKFGMASLGKLQLCLEAEMLQKSEYQKSFSNFLKNGLPMLKTLELVWALKPNSVDFDQEQDIMPNFPSLAKLEHFGTSKLQFVSEQSRLFVNQFLRSIAERCPTIKTFAIDMCSLCELISHNIRQETGRRSNLQRQVPWYTNIVFPHVESLILRMNFILGFGNGDSVVEASDRIPLVVASMFPRLQKLSVTGSITARTLKVFEEHIWPAILRVEGIRCLEIQPYYKNYLGQREIKGCKLGKFLEILVLKSTTTGQCQGAKPELIRLQELKQVLRNFPRLKNLEISAKLLLDKDGGTEFCSILEERRRFRPVFPTVTVKII